MRDSEEDKVKFAKPVFAGDVIEVEGVVTEKNDTFSILMVKVKLVEEFFRAVSVESRANIHLRQIYGDEAHHVCEGLFKSFARALRMAKAIDPNEKGVPSSKGVI